MWALQVYGGKATRASEFEDILRLCRHDADNAAVCIVSYST
jgi:hypothetical protein